jgi:hypothetical protein
VALRADAAVRRGARRRLTACARFIDSAVRVTLTPIVGAIDVRAAVRITEATPIRARSTIGILHALSRNAGAIGVTRWRTRCPWLGAQGRRAMGRRHASGSVAGTTGSSSAGRRARVVRYPDIATPTTQSAGRRARVVRCPDIASATGRENERGEARRCRRRGSCCAVCHWTPMLHAGVTQQRVCHWGNPVAIAARLRAACATVPAGALVGRRPKRSPVWLATTPEQNDGNRSSCEHRERLARCIGRTSAAHPAATTRVAARAVREPR